LYVERANAYLALGRFSDALSDAAMIIKLEPSAENFANCSKLWLEILLYWGDEIQEATQALLIQNAIQYIDRAIEIDSGRAAFYYIRGRLYIFLGEFEQVIMDMTKTIELSEIGPQIVNVYEKRGYAYINSGQFQKAMEDANMTIKLEPNNAANFCHRGLAYEGIGEREKALQDFARAIKINKDYAETYLSRASTFYKMGKYQEALNDLTEYIKREPTANAYKGMGMVYQAMADQEKNKKKKTEYQKKADENLAIMEQMEGTR
jgi:tetratricopeptide (TPR) repeat protein